MLLYGFVIWFTKHYVTLYCLCNCHLNICFQWSTEACVFILSNILKSGGSKSTKRKKINSSTEKKKPLSIGNEPLKLTLPHGFV